MKAKLLHIVSIFLIMGEMSSASGQERFVVKPTLSFLSGTRVYSVREDVRGAIWFYTIDGLIRYNGHSCTTYSRPLEKSHFASNGSGRLYANAGDELLCIETSRPGEISPLSFPGMTVSPGTVMLSAGDSLFISKDNMILSGVSDSLSLYACTPDSSAVSVLERGLHGGIVAGSASGVFLFDRGAVTHSVHTSSAVSGLYAEGGTMLAGLVAGGFFRFNPETGAVVRKFSDCHGKRMQHVRSFCRAGNGCVYIAASNGLFRLSPDDRLDEIAVDGQLSVPVYEVWADSSGNLWVCTVYNGVVYSNLTSSPFSPLPLPQSHPIKGLAQDASGTVWAATDGHGLFRLDDGEWSMVGGTEGVKYQRLFNVSGMRGVCASDWYGNLLNYYSEGQSTIAANLNHVPRQGQDNQVTSILKSGPDFLLGTKHGLFVFNPDNESEITRSIDCRIRSFDEIASGRDSCVWLSGNGLARYADGAFTYPVQPGTQRVCSIAFDEYGALWGCMDNVVFCVEGEELTPVREFGGERLLKLIALPDSRLFCLTEHHIIVYDIDTDGFITYGEESGLSVGSTRFSPCMAASDGRIWIAGAGGIEIFDPTKVKLRDAAGKLSFDRLTIGSGSVWHPGEAFVLNHDENDIVFDVADFDYTGIKNAELEYKLEGYDKDWLSKDALGPIQYSNLRPGRYTMRVRSGMSPEDEISCRVRIKPVWYASFPVIVMEILLVLSFIIYILHSRYAKLVLDEKLRLKNEEYERQTSFFINLSFKMRTPINLIIGQMEQYFKDYGSRSRGVGDIQEIYKRTLDLRGMISDYVDSQGEALEREPRNARVLNAVLGAIERNIFSKTLNVTLLCGELNMGKTKLTAVVKEATGMSPGEYIEDTRLRYAAEMLDHSDYTVGEVSDRLGFSSASYFSTRFKKKYGVAPSVWVSHRHGENEPGV